MCQHQSFDNGRQHVSCGQRQPPLSGAPVNKWLSIITRERWIHPDSESGGIPHLFGTFLSPHIGSAWRARRDNNNNNNYGASVQRPWDKGNGVVVSSDCIDLQRLTKLSQKDITCLKKTTTVRRVELEILPNDNCHTFQGLIKHFMGWSEGGGCVRKRLAGLHSKCTEM